MNSIYHHTRAAAMREDGKDGLSEVEQHESPVIDFEIDPPKPGDEYVCRDGFCLSYFGYSKNQPDKDKWVFESHNGDIKHYYHNGHYCDYETETSKDIVSRKPAEPIKHKATVWVNFYRNHKPDIYMAKQSATALRLADCLACKEIEIEWIEGEGL